MNRVMPQRQERKGTVAAPAPPKGRVTVKVGEEQQRFTVPVEHFSHPLFAELLAEAAEEYGFSQPGVIAIPCAVDHFRNVEEMIERGYGGGHRHHRYAPFHFPIWKWVERYCRRQKRSCCSIIFLKIVYIYIHCWIYLEDIDLQQLIWEHESFIDI